MGDIVASIASVRLKMQEIAAASAEQSIGIEQVNMAVSQMDQVTQQNAALVEEAAAAAASMQEQAERLADVASSFRLEAGMAAAPAVAAAPRKVALATRPVVASEVRNLAQRSAGAAKEIKELIGNSVDQVDIGSKLVQEAGATMDDVVASVRRVTDIMGEITSASSEQSIGIDQVNQAITQMDQVTQQNAALVEEAAATAASMQEQAERLADVASSFRLEAGMAAPALAATPRTVAVAARPAGKAATKPATRPATKPAAKPALASAPRKPATVGGDQDWEEF